MAIAPPSPAAGIAARHAASPLFVTQAIGDAETIAAGDLQRNVVARIPAVRARFHDAGHILGSAIIEIDTGRRSCFPAISVSQATGDE